MGYFDCVGSFFNDPTSLKMTELLELPDYEITQLQNSPISPCLGSLGSGAVQKTIRIRTRLFRRAVKSRQSELASAAVP
jgi:hypothetical protein